MLSRSSHLLYLSLTPSMSTSSGDVRFGSQTPFLLASLHINVQTRICDVRIQLTRSPRCGLGANRVIAREPQAHRSTSATSSFCVSALRRLQLIVTLFMPTQYSCVAGCSKTYERSSSLAHHKNRCSFAVELRKKSREIRSQKGDNGFPLKHMNISERTQRFVVCDRFIRVKA
jgi:hypothetical protein